MTLYLKYRPQTISDLDLKSVRDSLKNILSKNDIPHAFLFAGPKGTGKTSAARILAKAINCEQRTKNKEQEEKLQNSKTSKLQTGTEGTKNSSEFSVQSSELAIEPCNTCNTCASITKGENLDVIEIDAASHRGIDDIRTLREAVKLAPIGAKKKVYIIDEAHMLTTEACNALLKVLEEPPSHVVFVLATTNPEKLIDTIRSRTTLVPFTKASEEDVVNRLLKISTSEKITVNDEVLKVIAHGADGAFRDGVKLFEQIIAEQIDLTKEGVTEFLYGGNSFNPDVFLTELTKKEAKGALDMVEHGISQGLSAKVMTRGILEVLRERMLKEIGTKEETIVLLELFSKAYTEIPLAYLEQLPLEIAVVKWCDPTSHKASLGAREKPKKVETATGESVKVKAQSAKEQEKEKANAKSQTLHEEKEEIKGKREPLKRDADTVVSRVAFSEEIWAKVLTEVRPRNSSTEALLRASKPLMFDGKVLNVGVFYKFHKERLEAAPHRDLLEEILAALMGQPVRITCTLTEPPQKVILEEVTQKAEVVLTEAKNDDKIVDIAKEIFGGN